MDVEGRLRTMIDVFRRECHKVFQSERVTVHGADSMLMVLQLAMAEVNKQVFNTHLTHLSNPHPAFSMLSRYPPCKRIQVQSRAAF